MPQPLEEGLDRVRQAVLDRTLVRAVAAGRRRGSEPPPYRRVEVRPVDLKRGRHLQITEYDEQRSYVRNLALAEVPPALDLLLATGYANWHVTTTGTELQLRVTKRGEAQTHQRSLADDEPDGADRAAEPVVDTRHDRTKARLLPVDHPLWTVVGIADRGGVLKPSRMRKFRQVEEFLALLGPRVEELVTAGAVPEPSADRPLRVVDLGCGNAYLTFAAYAYLTSIRGWPTRVCGVDVRPDSRERNAGRSAELGWAETLTFVAGVNASAETDDLLGGPPDVVLSLHACDTATDEALARAVGWEAPLVLAAPCCHHDLQRQLRAATAPEPYAALTRHGILSERFADVLTDTFRASLLSLLHYRVDVVQFVESQHTPRNTLLRAVRLPGADPSRRAAEIERYRALRDAWQVTPALEPMVASRLPAALGPETGPRDRSFSV